MMHNAFSAWLLEPTAQFPEVFIVSAKAEHERMVATYLQKVGTLPSDSEMEPTIESIALGYSMAQNYQSYYGSPLPQGFTLVQPEQQISIPIPHSQHVHSHDSLTTKQLHIHHKYDHQDQDYKSIADTLATPHSHYHYLDGRLDAIIKDQHGRLYILEHKTYSSRPSLDTLQMNDQFLAYTWMLSQLGIGQVMGIAYDGLWKREEPPRGKTLADLFCRILLPRTDFELTEFAKHLTMEARDMASDPAIYPTRRWEGCYDCNFNTLCTSESRNEDSSYIRNTMYIEQDSDHKPVLDEV